MTYSVRLICTTSISLGSICMLFTTLDFLLSPPVDHCRQPVALKWERRRLGSVSIVLFRKIFVLRIAKYLFFITKYLLLQNIYFKYHIINYIQIQNNTHSIDERAFGLCRGRIPVTGMLASTNLSKPGMDLSKPGVNLSKPGKGTTMMW